MVGERLSFVPKEAQKLQQAREAKNPKFSPFGLISHDELKYQQKPEKTAAEQVPNGLRVEGKGITTYTDPTARENAASLTEGIGKITGPGQILLGVAAIPFTAGLSVGLIGGGMYDMAGNGYVNSDQEAQRNKRLLYEADSNKHTIVVKDKPNDSVPDGPIALKPGYVEIVKHDPITKRTEVNVKHNALPHEAAVFVGNKSERKPGSQD
jgi:hypothetical protein